MTNLVADKRDSLLKVTTYWFLFLVLLIPVASQSGLIFSTHAHRFVFGISGVAVALFLTWIFIRSEKKSFSEYSLVWEKRTLTKFLKGLAIGIASFSLITLILVLFAELNIKKNPLSINPWIWFWYFAILPAALMEEIVFRSYSLLKLNGAFGLWLAQLVVLVAFTLYHILLGWSILAALLGPGVWAVIFGIAAIRSKGISLSTGIHVGLNLSLSILGMSPGVESFFVTSQSESTQNTVVNLITRVLVLLVGILLTKSTVESKDK